MRCSTTLLLLILAPVLAVGCSRSAEQAPGPAAPADASRAAAARAPVANPCSLLSQDEASRAVGRKLVRSDLQHYGPVTRCRFFSADGDEPVWLDAEDAAVFEGLAHVPDAKPVGGIADQALWQHSETGTFLHILKGGRLISMGLPRTLAALTPEVETAAKLVAMRM